MIYNFPYLKDSAFLKKFDRIKIKEQYVKLIVLTFDEKPIKEIQGKIISGNISLDGSSAMRRTCNLTMIADDWSNNLTSTKHLLSINKKIEILIGFLNTTDQYKDFPILWFPQGVFVIISPNISHDVNGINISLTLHDKMALLNGECGGVIPASVIFNQAEDIDEDGNVIITQPTICQIIQQLVNHFGGQQLGKIIISDIDEKIKKVMKWTGSTPLYFYQVNENEVISNNFTTNFEDIPGGAKYSTFTYGQDVGYILTDFIYPEDLINNAGDTVTTILDKIKNMLGNYQYFYDIDGNFRFQEIKNYLNTSYSTIKIEEMNLNNYLGDYSGGKSVYIFEDGDIIQSYSNVPQYQQIKNDFIVWGKRTSIDGKEIPIRYHLAIDKKPKIGNEYKVFFFLDPDDEIIKAKKPLNFSSEEQFPEKGEAEQYYYSENNDIIYKWSPENKKYEKTDYTIETITTNDFRTELYMAGVASQPFGLNSNYYYTELKNEWPKLYDMQGDVNSDKEEERPQFKKEVIKQPSNIDFFLDFIDTPTALSEFSVENIGRRTKVIMEDHVNCIFQPDNPNVVLIEIGTDQTDELRNKCIKQGQEYCQVRPQIYSLLMNGGALRSAYEEIRAELYQYTNYSQQISLTTIPIYYLEPNTRITVRDNESGIFGDYMIKTISLPLSVNEQMSLSCVRAFERI